MVKILSRPEIRQAAGRALIGLGKLGIFAATSMLSNTIFKSATQEFIGVTLQDWKRMRAM